MNLAILTNKFQSKSDNFPLHEKCSIIQNICKVKNEELDLKLIIDISIRKELSSKLLDIRQQFRRKD